MSHLATGKGYHRLASAPHSKLCDPRWLCGKFLWRVHLLWLYTSFQNHTGGWLRGRWVGPPCHDQAATWPEPRAHLQTAENTNVVLWLCDPKCTFAEPAAVPGADGDSSSLIYRLASPVMLGGGCICVRSSSLCSWGLARCGPGCGLMWPAGHALPAVGYSGYSLYFTSLCRSREPKSELLVLRT